MNIVRLSQTVRQELQPLLPSDWRVTNGVGRDKTVKMGLSTLSIAAEVMSGQLDIHVYSAEADMVVLKTVYDFLTAFTIAPATVNPTNVRDIELVSTYPLMEYKVSVDFSAPVLAVASGNYVYFDSVQNLASGGTVTGTFANMEARDGSVYSFTGRASDGRVDYQFLSSFPVPQVSALELKIKTPVAVDVYLDGATVAFTVAASAEWQEISFALDTPNNTWAYITDSGGNFDFPMWFYTNTTGHQADVIEIDFAGLVPV